MVDCFPQMFRSLRPPQNVPVPKSAGLFRIAMGLAALALCGAARCLGDVTLPALISDNMVLQAESKMNVWGKADPGESVTVQMGPALAQTLAGKDGTWG